MLENEEYSDLRSIDDVEASALCDHLRERLVDVVSETGGHLSSNLGVVELTVAIHRVFDTTVDRLVFDVGHQCYVHKILTGRDGQMKSIRQYKGLAGFPKPNESNHDAFIAGHASNAVSVALGMATARTITNSDYHVIALLGDGALTGGLAYEGLSSAGHSGEPCIVILNDNGMSIAENVGGVAKHLAKQRLKPQYIHFKNVYRKFMKATSVGRVVYHITHNIKEGIKALIIPSSMFEDMGFQYIGPVDGHDVKMLTKLLRHAKEVDGPVLMHVRTVKGKGYEPAEKNPDFFHGVKAFTKQDGSVKEQSVSTTFSKCFGEVLLEEAQQKPEICVITAAMEAGTGLTKFSAKYPDRFFDVGIAEGHAVSFVGGMAKQGLLPVFAVYSTFLQRGFDMLIHDIAIQNLHAIFCVDRAGLVGEDGETHHGVFDVSFLNTIPNISIYCPSSLKELESMLKKAIAQDGPVAIRYPRGGEGDYREEHSNIPAIKLLEGKNITLVAYGIMINRAIEVAEKLKLQNIQAEVIKLNQIKPLHMAEIERSVRKTSRIMVIEDGIAAGGMGEKILVELSKRGVNVNKVSLCNCGNDFVPHGSVDELYTYCGLDSKSLLERAKEVCQSVSKKAD